MKILGVVDLRLTDLHGEVLEETKEVLKDIFSTNKKEIKINCWISNPLTNKNALLQTIIPKEENFSLSTAEDSFLLESLSTFDLLNVLRLLYTPISWKQ